MVDTEPTIVAFIFEGILLVAGKEKTYNVSRKQIPCYSNVLIFLDIPYLKDIV